MSKRMWDFALVTSVLFCAAQGRGAEIDLGGNWTLVQADAPSVTCAAKVPGDVHSALLAAGLIPDPYFGRNELKNLWVGEKDWTFARTFEVSPEFLSAKRVTLRLEDVDVFCTVYLNGTKLGRTEDRYRRWDYDVTKLLKPGRNEIRGEFESTLRVSERIGRAHDHKFSNAFDSRADFLNFVRTVPCHGGWDWGLCQMVTGFCGPVKLISDDGLRLDYIYSSQSFNEDLSHCDLTVWAEVTDLEGASRKLEYKFPIDNPPLWWPRGQGPQNFYSYEIDVAGEKISRKVGLRKIEVLNDKDVGENGKPGSRMAFRVNGREIFMKGANWIPCDAFETRQTEARYRDLLQSAANANMNMIRVWGGGQYEHDEFYETCDELGLLVWQDFMFSCALYPGDDAFLEQVGAELAHQLRRLRDHASIALWCGDNECVSALTWYKESKADRSYYLEELKKRHAVEAAAAAQYDPTRVFWPSSPCAGPGNFTDNWKSDAQGDMHNWAVWHDNGPFESYYSFRPRFCSEFGYQSLPSPEVALTFVHPEELNPTSPEFEWHQKNPGGNRRILETMSRYFRFPESVESILYLSQVQQAMAVRTAIEGWRRLRPHCMGTLYWQLNDMWPVASWSSLEYGGKWKHLHYHAKRFYKDVTVFAVPQDLPSDNLKPNRSTGDECAKRWAVWVVNDRPDDLEATVALTLWTFAGERLGERTKNLKLPAGSAVRIDEFASSELGSETELNDRFGKLRLVAKDEKGLTYDDDNELMPKRWKRLGLKKAKITAKFDGFRVTLTTDRPTFFTWAEAHGIRGEFDKNSFTLLPNEPRTIVFAPKEAKTTAETFRRAFSVTHLRETYR